MMHMEKDYKAVIKHSECESGSYVSALHPRPVQSTPIEHDKKGEGRKEKEELGQPTVTSKCIEMCGQGWKGRSCSTKLALLSFSLKHTEKSPKYMLC